jgi:hypothetical protein
MKKNFILSSILISGFAFSQMGINTETPGATLDVTATPGDLTKTDGLIAPRLKGSELKAKDANYDTPQIGAIVYITEALAAVDTTTKTANVTTLGYFYFDGSIWQKMTVAAQTWNLESTSAPATLNSQNIYQNGNVGIGNFSATNPIAKLDVRGAVRGGTPHANEINGTSAIGTNSVAFGTTNRASGANSVLLGGSNISTGAFSAALGFLNTVSGASSIALGSINTVAQPNSYAIGTLLNTGSTHEMVIGFTNATMTGSATTDVGSDVAFAVGNGFSNTNRSNAMTLVKNGNVGFGLSGNNKPTERIDIGTDNGASRGTGLGSIRIRAINTAAYTGDNTMKVVVADTNGILKTVPNTLTNTSIIKTTANYTVLATDFTILVNATGGGVTVTLPAVATNTGRVLVIRKTDETANLVTFSTPIKISETTSFTTLNLNATIRIQSDGTNWYKID